MGEYIVSARKYRPQTFDTVVGQEHITTTLQNAIRNKHLAHAYLFCGPRGVGKTTCARILARTINCEHPTEAMEACGVCSTCTSFNNNTSFNVFELDAASNNSVEDIRELTNQVRFAPQHGKYKVYIIDEVHMLSQAAFNAFLKTLEEPPPYAIFILATTEKHKILPTILSRCQIFDFKRITTHDIVAHLQQIAVKESMVAQEAALHVIAQKSEGCMRDALSMLDRIASFTNGLLTYNSTMEHLNMLDADFYFGMTDSLLAQDVGGALLILDQALEKGFEGDMVIDGLAEHFRNLLLCKDPRMTKLLDVPNEHKPMYYEKAHQAPPSFILSGLTIINDCQLGYKTTNNRRLHVELCLIRLCYLLQAVKPGLQPLEAGDVKKNSDPVKNAPLEQGTPTQFVGPNNGGDALQSSTVVTPSGELIVTNPNDNRPITDSTLGGPPLASGKPLAPTPPVTRRLSKDVLNNITTVDPTASQIKKTELSYSEAMDLFEQFKRILYNENKSIVHAQFNMMRLELVPPEEVKLISPSHLTDNYAKEYRSQILDFYREKTGMLVRITTDIQIDEQLIEDQRMKTMSKSEVYEYLAQKNPSLAKLKENLNLAIDY